MEGWMRKKIKQQRPIILFSSFIKWEPFFWPVKVESACLCMSEKVLSRVRVHELGGGNDGATTSRPAAEGRSPLYE